MIDLTTGKVSEATRDRVARAIYNTMPVGVRSWEDAPAYTRDRCFQIADAAIAELASIE